MLTEFQDDLVRALASSIPDEWDLIKVNVEIDEVHGEIVVSPDGDYFLGDKGEQLRFKIDLIDLFKGLRELMGKQNTQKWTVCYLNVSSDGKYEFKFSYDQPPRLTKLKNA